jgi:hypothetical protein
MPTLKRTRDDDDRTDSSNSKRRKRTSSVASADMSEDDRYLVQLKEDENLPWKDIVTRFHTNKGKSFQVAALQMRYKRLREKYRVWEDQDIEALKLSHEYWEKYKWEIISAKVSPQPRCLLDHSTDIPQQMLEFGLNERWPARHCARKWQEIDTVPTAQPTTTGLTPGMSQFTSPVETPMHFAFMPISQ